MMVIDWFSQENYGKNITHLKEEHGDRQLEREVRLLFHACSLFGVCGAAAHASCPAVHRNSYVP